MSDREKLELLRTIRVVLKTAIDLPRTLNIFVRWTDSHRHLPFAFLRRKNMQKPSCFILFMLKQYPGPRTFNEY